MDALVEKEIKDYLQELSKIMTECKRDIRCHGDRIIDPCQYEDGHELHEPLEGGISSKDHEKMACLAGDIDRNLNDFILKKGNSKTLVPDITTLVALLGVPIVKQQGAFDNCIASLNSFLKAAEDPNNSLFKYLASNAKGVEFSSPN